MALWVLFLFGKFGGDEVGDWVDVDDNEFDWAGDRRGRLLYWVAMRDFGR
jgi:hypothetical protein